MNYPLDKLFSYEQCLLSDKLWKIFKFIKLKKHCFIHQGFHWSYLDCKKTLPFPFAVSFIIKKNVQAYILRLDYLLYARTTLYARLLCGPTFRLCSVRAIIAAIVASWQCEQIIKTYKVLLFYVSRIVARRSTHRSLCERTLKEVLPLAKNQIRLTFAR